METPGAVWSGRRAARGINQLNLQRDALQGEQSQGIRSAVLPGRGGVPGVRRGRGPRGLQVGGRPLAQLAPPDLLPRHRIVDAHLGGRGQRSLMEVGGVEDGVVEHPLGVRQRGRAVAPVGGGRI